ncbi:MAG: thiamine-phosphate kinase [bacterium]
MSHFKKRFCRFWSITMDENKIIELIANELYKGDNPLYPGDDAFIEEIENGEYVFTCDQFIEGVHFKRDYFTYSEMACRSVYATVSDISAMGAKPLFYSICLGVPSDVNERTISGIADGLRTANEMLGINLIAGDTSRAPSISFSVFCYGISGGKPLMRSGAMAGDIVYITGLLGLADVGLNILSEVVDRKRAVDDGWEVAIERHISPLPRVDVGLALSQNAIATSCIDTSDSISICLNHLSISSKVGIEIVATSLPISDELIRYASLKNKDVVEMALSCGEDYELIFTASESVKDVIESISSHLDIPITPIGIVLDGNGVYIRIGNERRPLKPSGYSHFDKYEK